MSCTCRHNAWLYVSTNIFFPMKHILVSAVLPFALAGSATARELKVLAIGNSFSISLTHYFPAIVHAAPGHTLRFTNAFIGGCPLDRHWANIEETEKNPDAKQYDVDAMSSDNPHERVKSRDSINALIKQGGWDIISIQQASPKSWDYETYQPHADKLIAHIREHAPDAEIVIQQTWSYNAADNRIREGEEGYCGCDEHKEG